MRAVVLVQIVEALEQVQSAFKEVTLFFQVLPLLAVVLDKVKLALALPVDQEVVVRIAPHPLMVMLEILQAQRQVREMLEETVVDLQIQMLPVAAAVVLMQRRVLVVMGNNLQAQL